MRTVRQDKATASPAAALAQQPIQHRSELSRSWGRFKRYRPGLVGSGFIVLLCIMAIAAPLLAPYSPYDVDTSRLGEGPSASHPFGFDQIGRDVLSRTIYGSRVALLVGLIATGIAVAIGTTIGAVGGYFGGW